MATIARSTHRAAGRSFADRLRGLNLRFRAYKAETRARSRIIRELSTYTDDELADLGLSRGDIVAVASGTHRR